MKHGINVALFSLRTKNSCGCGEFLDLLPLIDWVKSLGMDIIQLLPLNDSGEDPSPYNVLSSCALNPIYLSLRAFEQKDLPVFQNASYQDIYRGKLQWLQRYAENKKDQFSNDKEFMQFVFANPWLKTEALSFQIIQFLCFKQLSSVKEYAESKTVLLFGDIPILVSPASNDVKQYPHYFNPNLVAGAPPDNYNPEGQYWGFPIFNWEAIKKDGYSWWKERLFYASHFYHLYRIDHVVGLFRIWAIPKNRPCKEGKFMPEDPALWIPQGKEILEMMLSSTTMLPIAEDLGIVPSSVRAQLAELKIPGTKVMRWERRWDTNKQFIPIQEYPPLSLTTVSTHDSETLQLWWRDKPDEAKAYADFKGWAYHPVLQQEQRKSILFDSHHTSSQYHINLLQEYLALFPELVWSNPEKERINIPGKILPTNWAYRVRPSIEELLAHNQLKEEIQSLIKS